MPTFLRHVLRHTDRAFISKLFTLALPITLQSILFSSKGMVDVFMIGQLSEADVAAMGVASRALFVMTILLAGISTGGAMLVAQYLGAENRSGIRQSMALTTLCSLVFALLTCFSFVFFAPWVMQLASHDPAVIALGSEYLRLTGASLLFVALIGAMGAGLRSIQLPAVSTWFSALGIALNIWLNWLLIFGHWGLPQWGLKGAAIATLLSCIIEAVALYLYVYARRLGIGFYWQDCLQSLSWNKIKRFLLLALPTTFNFFTWAAGLFTYTAIMGQASQAGLVALAVMTPIEAIALSLLVGIANAAGALTGHELGAKRYQQAYYQSIAFVAIGVLVTIIIALCMYPLRQPILALFGALSDTSAQLAETFFIILSVGIVLRSLPTIFVVGVLRAGGDVKFCLYQDMLTQWAFGIPITALAAWYFGAVAPVIYGLFFIEAIFKWFACIYRFKSKRWMNHLVEEEHHSP
ncbi:MATE family efflux transporter [Motilimonas pumila]|uniref:MATE family efflux transporter n=1 Tax=Motilimonas pumila TaxID=2303987 RepID=A0A418YIW2_9GAMM|nr:MATE family efflux transporter [Motilimonas pumila]RJG50570.1 MATE family efflux transporter [Motilimonas pumila]